MSILKNALSYVLLTLGLAITGCSSEDLVLVPSQMPIQLESKTFYSADPTPNRDESVKKYLTPGMRIRNGDVAGSGTICYYDKEKNLAWIISCSHLFQSDKEKHVILEFFYKNEKKLDTPAQFAGDVWAAKINGFADDISIITFTPDWEPNYFPIAKIDYEYVVNSSLYSVGCDNASEVACYFVKVDKLDKNFLVTKENSPRPGRSGGGLITEDGLYVGICVRTSDRSGNGLGYFVHLASIHKFCADNALEWLCKLEKGGSAFLKSIPIVDRNSPQKMYDPDYVPVP